MILGDLGQFERDIVVMRLRRRKRLSETPQQPWEPNPPVLPLLQTHSL